MLLWSVLQFLESTILYYSDSFSSGSASFESVGTSFTISFPKTRWSNLKAIASVKGMVSIMKEWPGHFTCTAREGTPSDFYLHGKPSCVHWSRIHSYSRDSWATSVSIMQVFIFCKQYVNIKSVSILWITL